MIDPTTPRITNGFHRRARIASATKNPTISTPSGVVSVASPRKNPAHAGRSWTQARYAVSVSTSWTAYTSASVPCWMTTPAKNSVKSDQRAVRAFMPKARKSRQESQRKAVIRMPESAINAASVGIPSGWASCR